MVGYVQLDLLGDFLQLYLLKVLYDINYYPQSMIRGLHYIVVPES